MKNIENNLESDKLETLMTEQNMSRKCYKTLILYVGDTVNQLVTYHSSEELLYVRYKIMLLVMIT